MGGQVPNELLKIYINKLCNIGGEGIVLILNIWVPKYYWYDIENEIGKN